MATQKRTLIIDDAVSEYLNEINYSMTPDSPNLVYIADDSGCIDIMSFENIKSITMDRDNDVYRIGNVANEYTFATKDIYPLMELDKWCRENDIQLVNQDSRVTPPIISDVAFNAFKGAFEAGVEKLIDGANRTQWENPKGEHPFIDHSQLELSMEEGNKVEVGNIIIKGNVVADQIMELFEQLMREHLDLN